MEYANVKGAENALKNAMVQIGIALVPVIEKFATKLQEPSVVNALVLGVEATLDKFVREVSKIPAHVEQEKIDDLCKIADEKRKNEFLTWLGRDEKKLNSLPQKQLVALCREGLCFWDYDDDGKEFYRFSKETDPWVIPTS